MIERTGRHLRRAWRCQFSPSTFDPAINSLDGVVQVGSSNVVVSTPADLINNFTISPTLSGTLIIDFPSTASNMKVNMLFRMSPGFGSSGLGMDCQALSVASYGINGGVSIDFLAFASEGDGTYNSWYITSYGPGSANYVQNASSGAVSSKDRDFTSLASFTFPSEQTYVTTVTSDTEYLKSGYVTSTYKGRILVDEDEWDYNRPYEGVTLTVRRPMTETVTTTIFSYDPPDQTTTVQVFTLTPMEHDHTFSGADFIPSNDPPARYYTPGTQLPDPPSPGRCVTFKGLGNYQLSSYKMIYEQWFPDGPLEPPAYREISRETKLKTFGEATGLITPPTFFPYGLS
jgi:hypothetical protein